MRLSPARLPQAVDNECHATNLPGCATGASLRDLPRQSSLGRNPCSVHTPFDKAAMTTARCEMLLSPGTVISMSIRGARFTRNSIDKKKPLVDTQYGMLDRR